MKKKETLVFSSRFNRSGSDGILGSMESNRWNVKQINKWMRKNGEAALFLFRIEKRKEERKCAFLLSVGLFIYLFTFFFSDFLPFSPPFLSAPRCLFFFRSSLSRVRPRTLTPGVSLCQFSGFSLALPSFFLVRNQFSSGDEVEDCTEFSSAVLPDWTPFQHRFFLRMEGPVLYRTGSTGIFWPNSDSARKVSARTMEPEPS